MTGIRRRNYTAPDGRTTELNPTRQRLAAAAAISRREVYTYDWTDKAWRDTGLGPELVTRWVNDLYRHKLAVESPGVLASDKAWIRLTDAGKAWHAKHAGGAS